MTGRGMSRRITVRDDAMPGLWVGMYCDGTSVGLAVGSKVRTKERKPEVIERACRRLGHILDTRHSGTPSYALRQS